MGDFYQAIQKAVIDWFHTHHRRDLPWRQQFPPQGKVKTDAWVRDPYYVWVCEVMSQQTQIDTIIRFFVRWVSLFPTVACLAEASEDSVRAAWAGLGYYRRALYLRRGAEYVMQHFGGILPVTAAKLREIPGIGPYTAAAIASICFGEKVIAVDGNVVRVISRLRGERDFDPKAAKNMKAVTLWGQALMDEGPCEDPGAFNEGLMEIGSTVCKPSGRPLCEKCPLQQFCKAHAARVTGEIDVIEGVIPLRSVTPKKKKEIVLCVVHEFCYGCTEENLMLRRFVVLQRPENVLLGGMLEFPSITCGSSYDPISVEERTIQGLRKRLDAGHENVVSKGSVRHIFSHIDMEVLIYHALWQSSTLYYRKEAEGVKTEETGGCAMEEVVCSFLTEGLGVVLSRIFVKTEEEIRNSSASRLLLKILQKLDLSANEKKDLSLTSVQIKKKAFKKKREE